jgi:hypothetical protein
MFGSLKDDGGHLDSSLQGTMRQSDRYEDQSHTEQSLTTFSFNR